MNPVLALLLRVLLHGLGLFAACLPRSWEIRVGRALGRFYFLIDGKRRAVARDNLRRCLPEMGDAERERLLRANYDHYGVLAMELAHMFTPIRGHWRAYVLRTTRVKGGEHWDDAAARGKGVLFYSAHLANWELSAAAGAAQGMRLTIVTRRLKPQWLHDWMEAARGSTGLQCVYQPRTMPGVLRRLRDGEGVVFVMDQYMPPPMGEPTRFFGVMVDTLAAIAPLAQRTGAAIIPVRQTRGPDGVVRVEFFPQFRTTGDAKADNQRLADLTESWIRDTPEQWLWIHRRFKNVDWSAAARNRA